MEKIILSIYSNPDEWNVDKFTFNHKGGLKIWIANGFWFCKPYSCAMNITFMQKARLWKAFKWWCANAPIKKVSNNA